MRLLRSEKNNAILRRYLPYTLAIILILAGGFLVYSPHILHPGPYIKPYVGIVNEPIGKYNFPLHVDGWNHISRQKQFLEEGLLFKNPVTSEKYEATNYEFGFHILLAFLSIIFFSPLISFAFIVPALFYMVGASLMFIYFDKFLDRRYAGLFLLVLLPFIRSNAQILGSWFLVPIITFLPLLSLFLLVSHKIKKPLKRNITQISLIVIATCIYPFNGIFLIAYYIIMNLDDIIFGINNLKSYIRKRFDKASLRIAAVAFPIIVITFGIIMFYFQYKEFILKHIIFRDGWTPISHGYTIIDMINPVFISFSLAGLYLVRRYSKSLFIFLTSFNIYFLFMTILFFIEGFTVLIPYQRILFLWQILLLISLAFTLEYILTQIISALGTRAENKRAYSASLFIIFIILSAGLVAYSIRDYYTLEPVDLSIQRILTDEEYSLIKQIKSDSVVLADMFISVTIYPLTGNKVVNCVNANLACKDQDTYMHFIRGDCYNKNNIAESKGIDYVISNRPFSCTSFRLVDSKSIYSLYEYKDGN